MDIGLLDVGLLAGACLLGSIPFGLLLTRTSGIDITKHGSGNIGATNVLRTVGKGAAIVTLASDILKGTAAVAIAMLLGANELVLGAVTVTVVLGHDFSIFRGFKGGKGVATSIGAMLLYAPVAAAVTIAVWFVAVGLTRVSAIGALAGFAALPPAIYALGYGWEKLLVSVIITLLLYIRHIPNIKKLMAGNDKAHNEKA